MAERNPRTGRFQPDSPLTMARLINAAREAARRRSDLDQRRVHARSLGYTGPLTRSDLP
jgi:hypothetical protein